MKPDLQLLAVYLEGNQRDVATFFGVSAAAVSAWNTGRFKPTDAPRSLLALALRVGEADPALLRQVASVDPGEDGANRLTTALGVKEAVRLIGGLADTRCTARLASLVEAIQREAPHLLDEPAPASAPPPPWTPARGRGTVTDAEYSRATAIIAAAANKRWPTTWTSDDGITVAIPEHVQGPSPESYVSYCQMKADWLRSQGLTTDVEG